jgi:hypothetical protein
MKIKILAGVVLATLILGMVGSGPAYSQASLNGPSTILNSAGSACKTTGSPGCAQSYSFAPSTGTSNTSVTAGPTTYDVRDTFNQIQSISTLSDFGAAAYGACPGPNCLTKSPPSTWNFQDNYDFTTPVSGARVQGATLSFAIPTFGVGLENVQARIVTFVSDTQDSPTATAMVGGTGPQMTVVDGWQTLTQTVSGGLTLYDAALQTTPLGAHTEYVLEVRGEALSAGGYTGTVTFTPVPVPAPLLLLLSGLIGLAVVRHFRPAGPVALSAGC